MTTTNKKTSKKKEPETEKKFFRTENIFGGNIGQYKTPAAPQLTETSPDRYKNSIGESNNVR